MSQIVVAVQSTKQVCLERVRRTVQDLAQPDDVVHLIHVLVEPVIIARRQTEVQKALQKAFQPIVDGKSGVHLQIHVLLVVRPCTSFVEPDTCKAQALCAAAAALHASVMVVGGSSHKLRNLALASLLLGHSVGFGVLQASTVPVYLVDQGRLALPPNYSNPQGPLCSWLHEASSPLQVASDAA